MPDNSARSDGDLVRQVLSGEIDSFGILVSRYERLARTVALRYVRDLDTADDVVQDSFVAAFLALRTLRSAEVFGVWLQGIVRRRAVSAWDRRSPSHADIDIDSLPASQQQRNMSDDSLELLELIDQLPEHERLVIVLKHFEGHTAAEIAAITEQPIGTVTKQLSRARQRLQQSLTPKEPSDEIKSES